MVAPQPAHDFRENRSALFLAVVADAPGVVQVVVFFLQRVLEPHVLIEPVHLQVLRAAVVVAPVLHEDPDGALRVLFHQLRPDVPAADVGEAADEGDDLAEIIRAEPRHREGGASAGARSHDGVLLRGR